MEENEQALRWVQIHNIERAFVQLSCGFASGAISSVEYKEAMKAFKFRDDEDRYWTIGATSGQWYVHQSDQWVPGEPPPELFGPEVAVMDPAALGFIEPAPEPTEAPSELEAELDSESAVPEASAAAEGGAAPAPESACPSCGNSVPEGVRFCTACGARVTPP